MEMKTSVFLLCIPFLMVSCQNNSNKNTSIKVSKTDSVHPAQLDSNTLLPFRGKMFSERNEPLPKIILVIKPTSLFARPDEKSDVIAKLNLGDSLELDVIDQTITNIEPDTLLLATYKNGANVKKGYVNGSCLAYASHLTRDNKSGKFIAVHYLRKIKSDTDFDIPGEILVTDNGRIAAMLPFKGDNNLYFRAIPNNGFSPNINCYMLCFGLEACDYANGELMLSWNGQKLDTICKYFSVASTSDEGSGGLYNDFIFPSDSGGKPNQLIAIEYDEYDDLNGKKLRYGSTTDIYNFQNGKFVQTQKGKRVKLLKGKEMDE